MKQNMKLTTVLSKLSGPRPLIRLFNSVVNLTKERPRRVSRLDERTYIEFQEIDAAQMVAFNDRVVKNFSKIEGVEWVDVNPHLLRVVVACARDSVDVSQLVDAVVDAERLPHGKPLHRSDIATELPDEEMELQRGMELLADVAGLWSGLGFRLLPFVPSLGIYTVGILNLIDHTKYRKKLEERFGPQRAELFKNLAVTSGQALSGRPLASLVDIAYKAQRLRELHARRRTWKDQAPVLYKLPAGELSEKLAINPRPNELPKGNIEKYVGRAWMLAIGSFYLSLVTTRSPRSALASLFGVLPRPANLGRDVFNLELSRILAKRGNLVLAPKALRLLDRVDCLVLQGDLVSPAEFTLADLKVRSDVDLKDVEDICQTLFVPNHPLEIQKKRGWSLGPLPLLKASKSKEIDDIYKTLSKQGNLVLALANKDEIVALQEVRILPRSGIREIISTATQVGIRVFISSDDNAVAEALDLQDTLRAGSEIRPEIERLQKQGHVVCYVGTADSSGIPQADLSVGLSRSQEPTPWGAHIVSSGDLSEVLVLVHAFGAARKVSKQSVQIAFATAISGTLVSGAGIMQSPSRRVMLIVNSASLLAMFNGMRHAIRVARKQPTSVWDPNWNPTPWHALDAQGVITRLDSSKQGLTLKEAADRMAQAPEPPSALTELGGDIYNELLNPLTPLLVAGSGLSAMIGSATDAAIIAGTWLIAAAAGGVQRFRTEREIMHLVQHMDHPVRVWRNNRLIELNSTVADLTPGDVVALGPGDKIPADCRVLEADGLEVDVSSITGESMPVPKSAEPSYHEHISNRESMLYAGTSIAAGQATAIVVATGEQTEMQRASFPKDIVRKEGGVEARLRSLMNLTGPVAAAAGIGLTITGLMRGRRLNELVNTGVSLAVAAVPEGLPVLATASQLASARRLSSRGIMVRNPKCVEALGRVDIICIDKTGTLTEGRLELESISNGRVKKPLKELNGSQKGVLKTALLSTLVVSDNIKRIDPVDKAIARGAVTSDIFLETENGSDERLEELPFEAIRGYHATLTRTGNERQLSIKGLPEKVLHLCDTWLLKGTKTPLDDKSREEIGATINRMASRGLRVIAVAEHRLSKDETSPRLDQLSGLTFLGMLLLRDRIRPNAEDAIEKMRQAGVRVVMLTGDHTNTAKTIAKELNLSSSRTVINGTNLAKMNDDELALGISTTSLFTRVTPPQKVRIVRAMQRAGHVVAMAGDGANDAHAIRSADVGLAIGEDSTPAARGAADIIIADAHIENIVDAIIEGRSMWVSVRNAVSILVGGNLGEIGYSWAAGAFSGRPPLNPRQLLVVNFLTDIAPAMAVAVRPPSNISPDALAKEGPEASMGAPLTAEIASRALVTALGAGTAWIGGRLTGTRSRANTIGLASLVCTQLGQTVVSGGLNTPVVLTSLGSMAVLAAIIQTPGLSRTFGCKPLGPLGWTTVLGASSAATGVSVLAPKMANWMTDRIRLGVKVLGQKGNELIS